MLFDQDELETWLKQGRIGDQSEPTLEMPATIVVEETTPVAAGVVDISSQRVYHRNARYR